MQGSTTNGASFLAVFFGKVSVDPVKK